MLDRRLPPAFNRNFSFDLIRPEITNLSDGTPVYFIHGGDQNVIRVEIILPAGKWNEATSGSSYFSTKLLSKGTQTKDSFQIASLFDRLGSHFEAHSGPDFVNLSLYSLLRNLAPSMSLFTEVIRNPSFAAKEFDQLRAVYLQNLKVNKERTSFLASRHFRRLLFGETHPYGRDLEEVEVNALHRDHLVSFHRSHFSPFAAIAVGKINESDRNLVMESLSVLRGGKVQDSVHAREEIKAMRSHLDKPGSVQSSIRIGKKGVSRSHPDYAGFLFLNHILGGYFGSRLMKNIREDKGLTYGIHSSLWIMKRDSFMIIGTDVNGKNKEAVFDEVRTELKRLRSEEIPAEELETARYHFIGSLQTELSTPFAHAEKIRNLILFDLVPNHYTSLIHRISTISALELRETANRYYVDGSFIEVSVG